MISFEVQVRAKALVALSAAFPKRASRETQLAFLNIGQSFESRARKQLLSGQRGSEALNRRTGSLARALTAKTQGGSINALRTEIGFFDERAARIATVHERGAVIRPRRAKYLTIPLDAALTPAGVARRPNARAWDRTFFAKSKSGNLFIMRREGRDIPPVPLYILRKSVELQPRLGFFKLWQSQPVQAQVARRLGRAIRRTLGGR